MSVSKIGKDTIIFASVDKWKILANLIKESLFIWNIYIFHFNNVVYDGFSIGEIVWLF